ncbi:MAG: WbqC family protein, partial [Ferruginibacter sp.]
TKKGWINRNRILVNGKDEYISFPLKKDSDYLNIDQRHLADSFKTDREKLLRKIAGAYNKAPQFKMVSPIIEAVVNNNETNLFLFLLESLKKICSFLEIHTPFILSSSVGINHLLKSQDKVIAICKALNTTQYINPVGGMELYSNGIFNQNNIQLSFLKSNTIEYQQLKNEFIPWLSIIDVMMFNSKEKIQEYLQSGYTII